MKETQRLIPLSDYYYPKTQTLNLSINPREGTLKGNTILHFSALSRHALNKQIDREAERHSTGNNFHLSLSAKQIEIISVYMGTRELHYSYPSTNQQSESHICEFNKYRDLSSLRYIQKVYIYIYINTYNYGIS